MNAAWSQANVVRVLGGLVCSILATQASASGAWLPVSPGGVVPAGEAAAPSPEVSVRPGGQGGFGLTVRTAGLQADAVRTPAGDFTRVGWPETPYRGEIAEPALPVIRRLFVAPAGATLDLTVDTGAAVVVDLAAADLPGRVLPAQPSVPKIPGAAERITFAFDPAAYALDGWTETDRVVVEELGIVRGQRLCLLEVRPVAYNPARGTLTVWSGLSAEVRFTGGRGRSGGLDPLPGLHRVILNPEVLPASRPRGAGNYLIVVADDYQAGIAPFATAKAAQGFTVTTQAVAAGTSAASIKGLIQDLWSTADPPDYVLLVGDTDTIPEWTGEGEGWPDTDLPYVCMDGGGDWYPDIALGRFPVRSSSQLTALVAKTLYYEDGPLADPEYRKRSVWMASVDHHTVSEGTHNYCIDHYMEPNGYSYDKLYQVTHGASTQDVKNSFNDGRFYSVFSGHGYSAGWADGPPFDQDDVAALTNQNRYSFVCSFACDTGDYASPECFMETWVLEPGKGAVTAWGSSVSSYWDEDDILEKRLFDVVFDSEDDVKAEVGPVYNETKLRYLAHFGSGSTTRRYFEMYNLMGDPSLPLPTACSDAGEIALDRAQYPCDGTVTVEVVDCGLNLDDAVVDTAEITVFSDSEPAGETVTLYETDAASARFTGSIELSPGGGSGVLPVAEGDTITALYIDEDDGEGGHDVEVTATAIVDCTPPGISGVQATDLASQSAVVTFDTDEPARGTVFYGTSCDALDDEAAGAGYAPASTIALGGLDQDTTYFYAVGAEDLAGNLAYDDNGGACYSFQTLPGPQPIHAFMLDSDPGWTMNGEWQFGPPQGKGGYSHGYADPNAGATGDNVYGINLAGDYSTSTGGPHHLVAGPLDCSAAAEVSLRFQRWLNADYQPYVTETIAVSTNGSTWQEIWDNGSDEIAEKSWSEQVHDISAYADHEPTVYIRWSHQVTSSGAYAYSGWNLDDVVLWGVLPPLTTVPPAEYEIIRGQHISGGLEDLFEADDSRLVVRLGFVIGSEEPPVWLELSGISPQTATDELRFVLEARATTVGLTQSIALYDCDAGEYTEVKVGMATTTDSVTEVAISDDPGRFIDPATGEVKARLSWKANGPVASFPWEVGIDRAIWKVKQ